MSQKLCRIILLIIYVIINLLNFILHMSLVRTIGAVWNEVSCTGYHILDTWAVLVGSMALLTMQ